MIRTYSYMRQEQTSEYGGRLWVDTYLDDCCITKTVVYSGCIQTMQMLFLGELYLTADSKLIYRSTGEPYIDR